MQTGDAGDVDLFVVIDLSHTRTGLIAKGQGRPGRDDASSFSLSNFFFLLPFAHPVMSLIIRMQSNLEAGS